VATIIWSAESNNTLGEVPRRGVVVGIALKRQAGEDDLDATISQTERDTFMGIMKLLGEMLQTASS
jgi:hypothetical protein